MDRCAVTNLVELRIAISDDDIDIDWASMRAASAAYDAGNESDAALWAKILTMSYDQGFQKGQECLLEQSLLATARPGGHA
jgi:hypothetical protein